MCEGLSGTEISRAFRCMSSNILNMYEGEQRVAEEDVY